MTTILERAAKIKPTAIHFYLDKVQAWVRECPGEVSRWLLCHPKIYVDQDKPKWLGECFRWRVVLRQPDEKALRWLAHCNDPWINQVELAVDFIFDTAPEKEVVFHFLHMHLVRPWHGKTHAIKLVRGNRQHAQENPLNEIDEIEAAKTRYDAPRSAPNKIVFYDSKHSRITGEVNCVHLEWRLSGLRTIRRAGIQSGAHLLNFSHLEFWQKRPLFFDVDPERLGRRIRNCHSGGKSRTAATATWVGRPVNLDRKKGNVLIKAHGSTQELVDAYGTEFRLRRGVLVPNSNISWLPSGLKPPLCRLKVKGGPYAWECTL